MVQTLNLCLIFSGQFSDKVWKSIMRLFVKEHVIELAELYVVLTADGVKKEFAQGRASLCRKK